VHANVLKFSNRGHCLTIEFNNSNHTALERRRTIHKREIEGKKERVEKKEGETLQWQVQQEEKRKKK
jgi:hypothetical protein